MPTTDDAVSDRGPLRDAVGSAGTPDGDHEVARSSLRRWIPRAVVGSEPRPALPRWVTWAFAVVVSIVAVWFWRGFWMDGHNGGDDFALYIDQGRSVIQGDVGATLARTRYAVDHSAWHTFSPYAYPWAFPLMLAGVMALTGTVDSVTGVDYAPLKLLVTLCFLVALIAYHLLLRRRVHPLGTMVLPLFFATNFVYVLHTDNVLSELPFMMALMLFVIAYDRVREGDGVLGPRLWPLVGLGLLVCFAFNIRREGLGLMAAVALGQLAEIATATRPVDEERGWRTRLDRARRLDWRAVGAPWAAFIGAAVLFQLLLPSDIAPRFVERDPSATAGLHRIVDNLRIYEPLLAEQLGLKDLGPFDTTAFGSTTAGGIVFWAVVWLALLGMVLSAVWFPRRELPVIGAFLGVLLFVLIAPFQTYRYIMALVPFLLYYAYQGLALPLSAASGRQVAKLVVIADLCVLAFVAGGWPDTENAREYRTNAVGPQPGPQEPYTLEMYRAVRDRTRGDAVIVANRARLMSMYTGRASVQGGSIDFIDGAGDFYAMYLEPDGTPGSYSQYPLTDAEAADRGFVEVWRNPGWVLWRIPPDDAP